MLFGICQHMLHTPKFWHKYMIKHSDFIVIVKPWTLRRMSKLLCLTSGLKSFIECKFVCAGFQSCNIGETKHHLPTSINEHVAINKKSHNSKHLLENQSCKNLCDENCFAIKDSASSFFRLKLKDTLHITWLKPNLNK